MIEQGILNFGGGILGVVVGYAVLKERVGNMTAILKDHITNTATNFKDHSSKLERVVYRDTCESLRGTCEKHTNERHAEVIRRLDSLEASFKTCMEDLVEAMKER